MSILLFAKQLVDMFYDNIILDYTLVGMVLLLIVYQWYLVRPTFSNVIKSVKLPDLIAFMLAVLITVSFYRGCIGSFREYAKILSAFLLYVLGRVAYLRIHESTGAIALSSYIVVYANVISRVIMLENDFFSNKSANGCIYYYDTDLGYAMLVCLIFISMYGRNNLFKFLTMFVSIPFMIINSGADVQKILLVIVYIIIFMYMGERAVKRRRIADFILPISIIGLLSVVMGILLPVFNSTYGNKLVSWINEHITSTDAMTSRYSEWKILWNGYKNSSIVDRLIGVPNNNGGTAHNQYVDTFSNIGILGIILMLLFIIIISAYAVKISERKTYYVTVLLAIVFLGTCINVSGMRYTQMNWFVMMYAGMAVASSGKMYEKEKC